MRDEMFAGETMESLWTELKAIEAKKAPAVVQAK
jgi:hypothetical protein